MLVKPSSLAKRTLASVKGPRTPSRGFPWTGRARCCETAVAAARPPIRVRLVIPNYAEKCVEQEGLLGQDALGDDFAVLRYACQRARFEENFEIWQAALIAFHEFR